MNILITIIAAIVGLIVLLLIIALFIKKETVIEREVIINKSKPEVFEYIKHIKNQDKYSKWNMTDPNMKKEYKGTDGAVGFVYSWDSENKNVGKGEQEIKNISEGEKIEMELRFVKPFVGVSDTSMATQSISEKQTKVKWGFKSKSKYPMNLMSAMMEGMLSKDLEIGLNNLKNNLEK
ncbi:MAG: SRPBCC family protein [Bacteroidia bacterium]